MNNRRYFKQNAAPSADFAPEPATTAQRSEIQRLSRLAEFDTTTVTYLHRRLGVAEHEIGRPVDEWLDSLNKQQASVVIDKLRKMVDEDEDDEDRRPRYGRGGRRDA